MLTWSAVSPEVLEIIQASIDAMQDPVQQGSCQAKYKEGIEAVGKTDFENMVNEAGETIANDVLRKKGDMFMDRAIHKYRRSVTFQEELQKARMDQKKKDKADNQKQGLLKVITN